MTIRDYSRESGAQRSGRDRKRHRENWGLLQHEVDASVCMGQCYAEEPVA